MTERQWADQVIDLAAALGWRSYRVENSTRVIDTRNRGRIRVRNVNLQGVGFPDLVLVRKGRLVFAELKRGKRSAGGAWQVTDEQRAWLNELTAVPCVEVFVWKPNDYDAMEKALR